MFSFAEIPSSFTGLAENQAVMPDAPQRWYGPSSVFFLARHMALFVLLSFATGG